jgi:hypothetical protein
MSCEDYLRIVWAHGPTQMTILHCVLYHNNYCNKKYTSCQYHISLYNLRFSSGKFYQHEKKIPNVYMCIGLSTNTTLKGT